MRGATRLSRALATIAVVCVSSPAAAGQMWGERQKLTAPDAKPATIDDFGDRLAVSGDTILVGAPGHGNDGAAYFFVRSGASWVFQQEVRRTGSGVNGAFGASVVLSGDTALVGAPGEDEGVVHVFVRSGSTWSEAQAIPSPDHVAAGAFGASIALDGSTAIIGMPVGNAPIVVGGAAYVYVLSGATWTLQGTLQDGFAASDGFGQSVALSGDTAIVGAPDPKGEAAYVFVRSGGAWQEQQVLAAPANLPLFGAAIAIEGDSAIVLSPGLMPQDSEVFGYARSGAAWAPAYTFAPSTQHAQFATGLAMRGGIFAVGVKPGPGPGPAHADVYAPLGGTPTLEAALAASDGQFDDAFGAAIALDGTTLVAGAPSQSLGAPGAAYVFVYASTDGDPCASDDACLSGHCVDGVCCAVASCAGEGPCNAAEHCQAGTGTCSVTPTNAGKPCTVDACTHDATCQGTVCQGTITVCPPADACHEFGECDPSSGRCSTPAKPDGAECPDGACSGGECLVLGVQPPGGCGCGVGDAPAGWAGGAGLALLLAVRRRGGRRKENR